MNLNLSTIILSAPSLGISEIILIIIFISFCLGFIPTIFYLITLQNTLKEISIENRKMKPSQVWLMLIPLFGIAWQFIMINRISESLKSEFSSRSISINEEKPGYNIGLTYCILFCCGWIPVLGLLAAIGGLVCWIVYWVKINDFKKKLQQSKLV